MALEKARKIWKIFFCYFVAIPVLLCKRYGGQVGVMSVEEAMKAGCVQNGTFTDPTSGRTMSVNAAVHLGLLREVFDSDVEPFDDEIPSKRSRSELMAPAPTATAVVATVTSVSFLVHPAAIACGVDLSFTPDVFFQREISEMRGPTGVKFCTVVSTRPNFIMTVQNFGSPFPVRF